MSFKAVSVSAFAKAVREGVYMISLKHYLLPMVFVKLWFFLTKAECAGDLGEIFDILTAEMEWLWKVRQWESEGVRKWESERMRERVRVRSEKVRSGVGGGGLKTVREWGRARVKITSPIVILCLRSKLNVKFYFSRPKLIKALLQGLRSERDSAMRLRRFGKFSYCAKKSTTKLFSQIHCAIVMADYEQLRPVCNNVWWVLQEKLFSWKCRWWW